MTSQVVPLVDAPSATGCLESGNVLLEPHGFFTLSGREQPLFSPSVLASGKNVSFDPATRLVSGSSLTGELFETLGAMLARFSDDALAAFFAALSDAVSDASGGIVR